ncbi:MAG: hypothetical protein KKF30_03380 [Proteobacteria bacterium]|nr:hypothetical protein [Pseudomonadota bacterium]MBU4471385.1 hypothetical protein [Pseudomonadota bacterium]MCG2751609.1 hypothetical protein [Desulfobacteraceae bacterium]
MQAFLAQVLIKCGFGLVRPEKRGTASEAFPEAFKELQHWLQPVQDSDYLIHLLCEAKLCGKFPKDALSFLDTVLGDDVQWIPRKLKQCLDDIKTKDQNLGKDIRFVRIIDLIRRRGTA